MHRAAKEPFLGWRGSGRQHPRALRNFRWFCQGCQWHHGYDFSQFPICQTDFAFLKITGPSDKGAKMKHRSSRLVTGYRGAVTRLSTRVSAWSVHHSTILLRPQTRRDDTQEPSSLVLSEGGCRELGPSVLLGTDAFWPDSILVFCSRLLSKCKQQGRSPGLLQTTKLCPPLTEPQVLPAPPPRSSRPAASLPQHTQPSGPHSQGPSQKLGLRGQEAHCVPALLLRQWSSPLAHTHLAQPVHRVHTCRLHTALHPCPGTRNLGMSIFGCPRGLQQASDTWCALQGHRDPGPRDKGPVPHSSPGLGSMAPGPLWSHQSGPSQTSIPGLSHSSCSELGAG